MGQEIEHLFNMITGLGAEEKKGELCLRHRQDAM
jgi:hypothetical protein